ncbi:hypothetical protein SVIOM342S_10250 [Streptomyces violaceorubidus]
MSSDTLAKSAAVPETPDRADLPRIVPHRRPGQWTAAAVVLVLLALAVNSVLRNDAFQWGVVADWFTSDSVLRGLWLTLWLTAVVMVLGFALGTLLAAFRLSANPVLRAVSWGYVWLFRVDTDPGAAVAVVQHRRPVPAGPRREDGRPARPGHRGGHRPHPARGRVRRRGGARRHPVRGPRPGRGRAGARPEPVAPVAADRPPAGHARHRPAGREHADRDPQGHLHRQRHRRTGPALLRAARLPPHLPGHPAAHGGHRLVHRDHLAARHRPVLRREALRPRHGAHP